MPSPGTGKLPRSLVSAVFEPHRISTGSLAPLFRLWSSDQTVPSVGADKSKEKAVKVQATKNKSILKTIGSVVKLRRIAAAAAACVAAASMATLLAPSFASATTVTGTPLFGCYATSSGGDVVAGNFTGSPGLKVADDGRTTSYAVLVYRFNGSAYVPYGRLTWGNGSQTYTFSDTTFGQLNQPMFSGAVPHGYYRVLYVFDSAGDTSAGTAWGSLVAPITPGVYFDSWSCRL